MNCSLCNKEIKDKKIDNHGKIYNLCNNCGLIQLDKKFYLSSEAEKQRYKLHENSPDNKGYLNYLSNIISNSITPFIKPGSRLLDFGCGPEKTWAELLTALGYQVSTYDPFFDTNMDWVYKKFDAVTAIEVFEHLWSPAKELEVLNTNLSEGSYLVIRTMLHNNNWDHFKKWWYKDDPTHVSFYSKTTIDIICRTWNYEPVQIKDQCEIVLRKKSINPT